MRKKRASIPNAFSRVPSFLPVVISIAFLLFFKVGTYPKSFLHWEPDSAGGGVCYYVLRTLSKAPFLNPQWAMSDLAGGSMNVPVAWILKTGMQLFGFSLVGLRVLPTILGFLALLVTYYCAAKTYSKRQASLFVLLLASSPLYLMHTRSGLSSGLTLSFVLVTCSLYIRALSPDGTVWMAIAAGATLGLLPYGYAIARPIPIFLILLALVYSRASLRQRITVVVSAFVFAAYNLFSPNALGGYFKLRGENLVSAYDMVGHHNWLGLFKALLGNAFILLKQLTGFSAVTWSDAVAYDLWTSRVLLYPLFAVPIFLIGVGLTFCHWKRAPKKLEFAFPFLALGIASVPGLGVGVGQVNATRTLLLILPICFFMMMACNAAIAWACREKNKSYRRQKLSVLYVLLALLIFGQAYDYFGRANRREKIDYSSMESSAYLLREAVSAAHHAKVAISFGDDVCIPSFTVYEFAAQGDLAAKEQRGELTIVMGRYSKSVSELRKENIQYLVLNRSDESRLRELAPIKPIQERREWRLYNLAN